MIITAGTNVYPHEVELALASVPGVAAVVAAGQADDLRGQRVVAAVLPSHGGVTGTQLRAGVEDVLARNKRPLDYLPAGRAAPDGPRQDQPPAPARVDCPRRSADPAPWLRICPWHRTGTGTGRRHLRRRRRCPALLPADRQPVIIAARRTPVCRAHGALKTLHAHELLAPVLRRLLADAGVPAGEVADVVIGNAVGGGGNVARLAALEAGLPVGVPGLTVDRQCGSGLDAIVLASRLVASGGGSGGGTCTWPAEWRASARRHSGPGQAPAASRSSSAAPGSPPAATATRTWEWPPKTSPSASAFRGSGRTTSRCAATGAPSTPPRPAPSTARPSRCPGQMVP